VYVSDGVARLPVLPRKVAAGVSVFAVTRTGHAVAGGIFLVCIPGVIVLFVHLGYSAGLFESLAALLIMLGALCMAIFRTSPLSLALYLVVGGLGDYLFVFGMLDHHLGLLPTALVLVNRPETALILVGTAGSRPLPAVVWGVGGFAVGVGVMVLVDAQLGIPLQIGNGPAITLVNYSAIYIGLAIIQRAQRLRVPDFLQLRRETRRIEQARTFEQRTVALLHDTVLNDLSLVINGPDVLDFRTTERMRRDVAMLANTSLVEADVAEALIDASDVSLRNQMIQLASDFQWRGLTVEFTGDTGSVARMTPDAVTATIGALRACLENVLAHSGVDSAEVVMSTSDSYVTWAVNDAGRGFDASDVETDRLGLRSSVFARVESAGGVVKVWSAPGSGTSVLFTLPLLSLSGNDGGELDD
jgi:signal transduction histidine kinase